MDFAKIETGSVAFERHGHGAPLLLIHGFPLDHGFWLPLLPHLEAFYDVIMPDLPGFGESEIPPGSPDIAEIAGYLAALLDHLKIGKTNLAGHSMGGYVALAFAHAYPDRVLGLGLVNSQAAPDNAERQAARYAQAEKVALNGPQEVAGMSEKLSADASLAPFFREMILRQPVEGIIIALKAMAGRPDAAPWLPDFRFPVALIHGQADALIPLERSREMKQLIPQAVLSELPGVGHSAAIEAPRETAQALLKLSGQSGL